jgi:hypothetical protein
MPERPEVELDAIERWGTNDDVPLERFDFDPMSVHKSPNVQASIARIGVPEVSNTFSTIDAALLASVHRLRAVGENFADPIGSDRNGCVLRSLELGRWEPLSAPPCEIRNEYVRAWA